MIPGKQVRQRAVLALDGPRRAGRSGTAPILSPRAREAVPGVDEGRPNKGLIFSLLAAAGAVLFFWRRKGGDGEAQDAE